MKKIILYVSIMLAASNAAAWDFSLKADAQKGFTDNVNLTNTDPIEDSFSVLGGYLQAKNEEWRLRLKGKLEKYSKQSENDNYSTDLSLQYKRNRNNDYSISFFKQVYNGTPLVVTDTTSDNSGVRLAANFMHDFHKNTQGYFALSGTLKDYSKIEGRKDKLILVALGFEHYFAKYFLVSPELSYQHNSSADSYYTNNSYGPNLLLSCTPGDAWELFINGNYSHSSYTSRSVSKIVRNRTLTEKEYQELISLDAGVVYSFPQYLSLTGKYSNSQNNSNNPISAYKASIYYFGIGLKY